MAELRVVVGLGKTGLSCVRYLLRCGYPVAVTDTRDDPPALAALRAEFANVPVYLGGLDSTLLLQAKELIVSPGLALSEPAIAQAMAHGIPAIGDIELFARKATAPVAAITGANAKSTVTTLVGEMAKSAGLNVRVGGNLGLPALELLAEKEPDLYVLELSSFQLETTHSLTAQAAAILNISADHMDRYNTMAEYVAAKQRIYSACQTAIYNRDDPKTVPFSGKNNDTAISFGLTSPQPGEFGLCHYQQEEWLAYGDERLLAVNELGIKGRHNWANALAALALGHALKLSFAAMLQTLRDFPGLPHRCQWLGDRNGVHWYNDSKGTNVGATLAALSGLGSSGQGKIILIAGGLGKGADFTVLQTAVAEHVRTLILLGRDAPLLADALANSTAIRFAHDMQEAVVFAAEEARQGDAVLLSPACASYDMFRDFEHRGEVFIAAVRSLA